MPDTLPYRFEFETDEQYEARTGVQLHPSTNTSNPQSTAAITSIPDTGLPDGSRFVLPWWLVVIIFLLLVIGFYESYRRRLTKALQRQHPAANPPGVDDPPAPMVAAPTAEPNVTPAPDFSQRDLAPPPESETSPAKAPVGMKSAFTSVTPIYTPKRTTRTRAKRRIPKGDKRPEPGDSEASSADPS